MYVKSAAGQDRAVSQGSSPYAIEYQNGLLALHGEGRPTFTFLAKDEKQFQKLFARDPYTLALAFINEDVDVEVDLVEAIRFYRKHQQRSWRDFVFSLRAWLVRAALPRFSSRSGSCPAEIEYHYDRSNQFYELFLDPQMVYSCAYYGAPDVSLEEAQVLKLDHICRKLDLHPCDRFLDIGCGWGALVLHSASQYGVEATGCTLSAAQLAFALDAAHSAPSAKTSFAKMDYRELSGQFDKIASVGMFEHVGKPNMESYVS